MVAFIATTTSASLVSAAVVTRKADRRPFVSTLTLRSRIVDASTGSRVFLHSTRKGSPSSRRKLSPSLLNARSKRQGPESAGYEAETGGRETSTRRGPPEQSFIMGAFRLNTVPVKGLETGSIKVLHR